MSDFVRSFALEDIKIRSGGDGRTVEAYAAVFNTPTTIHDRDGRYNEQIDPAAFNKTIADKGARFAVFYNHGNTLAGSPSERGSVPIGSAIEAPKADSRGLLTVSRYNRSEQADAVLESIRNGDITGQSFSGSFIRSSPVVPRGGFRAGPDGALNLVTRHEISMREYGPTPMPAYDVPMMVGVRSVAERAHIEGQLQRVRAHFSRATLTAQDNQTLTFMLAQLAAADAAIDPIVDALCAADAALDAAQMVVSAMLAVPNPDPDPDEDTNMAGPGTDTMSAAAEEPRSAHSGRPAHIARIRAAMISKGISQ